jgi:hypothetical protein
MLRIQHISAKYQQNIRSNIFVLVFCGYILYLQHINRILSHWTCHFLRNSVHMVLGKIGCRLGHVHTHGFISHQSPTAMNTDRFSHPLFLILKTLGKG